MPTLAILVISLILGCSESPQDSLAQEQLTRDQLVGKWQEVGKTRGITEYYEDGTFIMMDAGSSKTVFNGNWTVLQDGRLKIDFILAGEKTSVIAEAQIEGDRIITKGPNGDTHENTRIK